MWLFQGVLNAGLQILLSIFAGWLCARLRLVDPEIMSRNVNAFAMKAAYPAFIIHLLGVKTNLRDGEAWRALGVFVLWVVIIHLTCLLVHRLRGKRSSVLQLGLGCLLLTTNNTGCIGWPVLIATVGPQSAVLSMLLGVLFFVQLLPVATCCFETDKWQHAEGQQLTVAAGRDLNDLHTEQQQLPVAQPAGKDAQWALPSAAFPHEFRYCYWSNELYQPHRGPSSSYASLASSVGGAKQAARPATLTEVCVEQGTDTDDEAAEHHCFGGGSHSSFDCQMHTATVNAGSKTNNSSGSQGGSGSTSQAAPGREWWRAGRPVSSKPQGGGLKRAKDSCDSLYTPFAAAAVAEKQAQFEKQQLTQHRPSTLGLSSLTRRLSKSLAAAGAAAAASTAGAATAGAASISGLMRAASLHTAGSLTRAQSLKHAVSSTLKPAGSLRRSTAGAAAAAKDPGCPMSVPLMSEHSDSPPSCCASHRVTSPPTSPHDGNTQQLAAGGAGAAAAARADGGDSSIGGSSGGSSRSSSRAGSRSSSSGGGCAGNTAAAPAAAAAGPGFAAGRASHRGAFGQQWATDSAVELHCMCDTLSSDTNSKLQRQQAMQLGGTAGQEAVGSTAGQGSCGSFQGAAHVLGKGSAQGLHTLCAEELSGWSSHDAHRINSSSTLLASSSSRSNLLPAGGITSSNASKGASKLGGSLAKSAAASGTAAAAAEGGGGSQGTSRCAACAGKAEQAHQRQRQLNVWQRFVQRHKLLCHIVWGQLQSFHLWLNIVAIALSVSGVRKYLDPAAPEAIPALGFVDGVLAWFSAACIPTLLFANGVWMCGKDISCGGWRGQVKVLSLLLLKLTLLPALMIGLTLLCGIRGPYGLSLVLLASCPLAPLAFLVCQQYGYGAELATAITIQGVLLMLPQMMAVIKVNQIGGLYDVKMLGT